MHETVAPFDPAAATQQIAKTLKAYGVVKVTSDRYAAQWPVSEMACNDITLECIERDRTAIYADFLPLLTSGRARLLDSQRLVGQLCNLERRASPLGRDRIDQPAGAHVDLSNSAAGALVLAASASCYWASGMDWVRGSDPLPAEFAQLPYFARIGGLPWHR